MQVGLQLAVLNTFILKFTSSIIHNRKAFDRLEVLEATCESIEHCTQSKRTICSLTKKEVEEVDSVFFGGLIPKSG